MILSTLIVSLLGVDAGAGPQVYVKEDTAVALGRSATLHGMVRTLPPMRGMIATGLVLDDGTPIYFPEGDPAGARVWALSVGQYVTTTGVLNALEQPLGALRMTKPSTASVLRHYLDRLDRREVMLEGRASRTRLGAPTLMVDEESIALPKLKPWPENTFSSFVILKGTLKREPSDAGMSWVLDATEWVPAERRDPK